MPRQARLDAPGVLHHIMARGIEHTPIFRDKRDRENFIERLAGLASDNSWNVYAWALITNHFHLLVKTGKSPLSRNMRSLMSGYAGYFNRRHKRSGHLFQNRYKSIVCEEETYFLELVRYVHLNPLRAKMVHIMDELDNYKFTGHSAIMGKADRPWQNIDEVLGRFSEKRKQAVRLYREFVAAGVKEGRRPDLSGGGLLRSSGGWPGVTELRRGREKYRADERVLGSSEFIEELLSDFEKHSERKNRPTSLDTVMNRVSEETGISRELLTGGGRDRKVSKARGVLASVWIRHLGRSGYQLASVLGVSSQSLYAASKRIEAQDLIKPEDIERWCK